MPKEAYSKTGYCNIKTCTDSEKPEHPVKSELEPTKTELFKGWQSLANAFGKVFFKAATLDFCKPIGACRKVKAPKLDNGIFKNDFIIMWYLSNHVAMDCVFLSLFKISVFSLIANGK